MAITLKKITLWRKEVDDKPGALADTLALLAQAGTDLQAVMGYRYQGDQGKAAIELHPVSGKKAIEAARSAGLAASPIPTVLLQGDNRRGLGHTIAKALGDASINLGFVLAQVVGRKYAAVFGFENDSDAAKAIALIRKAAAPARKR